MSLTNIQLNIKYLISKENLTPEAFAKKIGVAKSTIYNYLDGSRNPKANIRGKIAKYFKLSVTELESTPLYSETYKLLIEKEDNLSNKENKKRKKNTKQKNTTVNSLEKIERLLANENLENREAVLYELESLKANFDVYKIKAARLDNLIHEIARLKSELHDYKRN